MTIKWFNDLLKQTNYKVSYYKEVASRNFFKSLANVIKVKESFVKMLVCVLEK